ncbi:hypothetical protein [Streptomyces sp. 8L]|uniref:hypothetical protein n=1 Tax=Streptomyces sp. 8L TaxID=2877242 RepID=UPI001CD55C46|nr:hypothetical protein [Streptomyces sp. 8L]MCA1217123.1 hypothetical protein [Streptomyces sp. 8L]
MFNSTDGARAINCQFLGFRDNQPCSAGQMDEHCGAVADRFDNGLPEVVAYTRPG